MLSLLGCTLIEDGNMVMFSGRRRRVFSTGQQPDQDLGTHPISYPVDSGGLFLRYNAGRV
jgi:hypothetical protein